MARERTVLTQNQFRALAMEHSAKMNKLIDDQNQKNKLQQQSRLKRFVHEALGQMGAEELIEEWLEARQRVQDLEAQFSRLMGKKTSMQLFDPANQPNLLEAVHQRRVDIPPEFYRQLDNVLARHGIQPGETTEIPRVEHDRLFEQLRNCKTENEVMLHILNSQAEVIQMLGLDKPSQRKGN